MIVSVKGGKQLNPATVRDLRGTMERLNIPMSLFVCLTSPTPRMQTVANVASLYTHPPSGTKYLRMQITTVKELFEGKCLEERNLRHQFNRCSISCQKKHKKSYK